MSNLVIVQVYVNMCIRCAWCYSDRGCLATLGAWPLCPASVSLSSRRSINSGSFPKSKDKLKNRCLSIKFT